MEDIQGTFKQIASDATAAAQTPTAESQGVQAPQTYTKFATIKPASEPALPMSRLEADSSAQIAN